MRAPRPPASLGMALADIVTPALLISMPVLEANEARMRTLLRGTGVALRPHAKLHKSEAFAKWHIEASAAEPMRGFCAQTVNEAASCLRAGSPDVLLTNSLPRHGSMSLAALAAEYPATKVAALVDCPEHVATLEEAARKHATRLGVYIEIECGQDRCGCAPASDTAVGLAQALIASDVLSFDGLHVYHGAIQHVRSPADRQKCVNDGPAAAALATVKRLSEVGISVPIVTGGGTGTFREDLKAGTHNELQPGSYLVMDGDYGGNEEFNGDAPADFHQALYLHATVIHSNVASGKRVVDCGSKAVDLVSGMPRATSIADPALAARLAATTFKSGGDEHGILLGVADDDLPVGATVQIIPSHCDPTVNLHDWMVGVRDGIVDKLLEIDARGPG